jgi:hypothetical protein
MRLMIYLGLALVWIVLWPAELAIAQQPSKERVVLSLNGGLAANKGFTEDSTFKLFAEDSEFSANHKGTGLTVDATIGTRLWRNLAISVGVSAIEIKQDVNVTANLSHPFYLDRHRQINGSDCCLMHREIGIHIQPTWVVPISDWLHLSIFGGPTFFKLDQDLIKSVKFNHSYPFDTASFNGTTTETKSGSAIGFNAGIDVNLYFSRVFGIGWMARISHATVKLTSVNGDTISADAGGLQVGAGLRLRF